jgi:hypothetical protein
MYYWVLIPPELEKKLEMKYDIIYYIALKGMYYIVYGSKLSFVYTEIW